MTSFQANGPNAQASYTIQSGKTSSDVFINIFQDRDPTPYDNNYPVKKRWMNIADPLNIKEWILKDYTNASGETLANWLLVIDNNFVKSITGDDGVIVTPDPNDNINLFGNTVPNATYPKPVYTESPAPTIENISVQVAAEIPSTDITRVGLAAFLDTQFDVDADGFVSLTGGTSPAVQSVNVDGTTPPGTDPVLADAGGQITVTGAQIAAETTANSIRTFSTAANQYEIQVQRSSAKPASTPASNGVSHFDSAFFSVDPDGFVSLAAGTGVETLSDNDGNLVNPDSNGNIQLKGQLNEQTGFFSTITADALNNSLRINPMSSSRWIVDPLRTTDNPNGTHTTIASAITSAQSGDTIFIMPGTYTENLTLKAGVNLAAYDCDGQQPNVTIRGNTTFNVAGSVTLSGLRLQTNGSNAFTVSGANDSDITLRNCFIDSTNATGISITNTNSASRILFQNCNGNTAAGQTTFAISGNSSISVDYCQFLNSGSSTVASTVTGSAAFATNYSIIQNPLSISTSANVGCTYTYFDCNSINQTALTSSVTAGANTRFISCYFRSGTASAISVGAGTTIELNGCYIESSNTNNITGAGTLDYEGLIFQDNTNFRINTTTVTGGTLKGNTNAVQPSAGFLGQRLVSTWSGVALTTNTPANGTSLVLTPGIWDVTAGSGFSFTGSGNNMALSISTASATLQGNLGDQLNQLSSTNASEFAIATIWVANFRVAISANTTYYAVVQTGIASGTATSTGRLSAVRVG